MTVENREGRGTLVESRCRVMSWEIKRTLLAPGVYGGDVCVVRVVNELGTSTDLPLRPTLELEQAARDRRDLVLSISYADPPVTAEATAHVPWPKDRPEQYNASNEPCDMWTGPCSCGAWHTEGR